MKNLSYLFLIFIVAACSSEKSSSLSSRPPSELKDQVGEIDYSRFYSNLEKRLNYLESIIDEPLDSDSRISKLMETNAEWILFTYSFTTFSCYHLLEKDSISKERAEELMKKSIEKALDPGVSMHYSTNPYDLKDFNSVLYLGHLNMMLGMYCKISDDDSYEDLFINISKYLEKAFMNSTSFQLESYPEAIWISDNAQAMASLKFYQDFAFGMDMPVIEDWKNIIQRKYTETVVNLPYSTVNFESRLPEEEPRGSMLGWIIMFTHYFDKEWADSMYKDYKTHFSADSLTFRMFRERYNDFSTNVGDIDSGPIINGFSIPASQFALICAINAGDQETIDLLYKLVRFGTQEIETETEFKYKTRMIEFEISPLAEALMLYAESVK